MLNEFVMFIKKKLHLLACQEQESAPPLCKPCAQCSRRSRRKLRRKQLKWEIPQTANMLDRPGLQAGPSEKLSPIPPALTTLTAEICVRCLSSRVAQVASEAKGENAFGLPEMENICNGRRFISAS